MALSATLTTISLEYLREALHLRSPVRLYERPLDRTDITYSVAQINKPGYEELDFLLPKKSGLSRIPKTMVFVDSLDEGIALAKYLRSRLPGELRSRGKKIVRSFLSDLEPQTKTDWLQDLLTGDTRILICTEAAGMGVNISDIKRVVQWKIYQHLTFAAMLQRIGRAGRDTNILAVSIVFVGKKYIMPRQMSAVAKELSFARSAVTQDSHLTTAQIVRNMYEGNFQIREEGKLSPYHQVDPPLLWFINMEGCRRRLALACFADRFAFGRLSDDRSCCDNCHYAQIARLRNDGGSSNNGGQEIEHSAVEGREINPLRDEVSSTSGNSEAEEQNGKDSDTHEAEPGTATLVIQEYTEVPSFQLHGVTSIHSLRYLETMEWSDILDADKANQEYEQRLTKEKEKLLYRRISRANVAIPAADRVGTLLAIQKMCESALDSFANELWPNVMDQIMFPLE